MRAASPLKHIVLYGPPGCGKTSVSAILARRMQLPVLDVDNDWLELRWNQSVGEKLKTLGDDRFLVEEDKELVALAHALKERHVVALTGSNPLKDAGLNALKQAGGLLVYLDVPVDTIEARLHKMKVDRIVGMQGRTLREVLRYRYSMYEAKYDLRVTTVPDDSPSNIASKVIRALEHRTKNFVSTREITSPRTERSFASVLTQGLAPDGGLFMPDTWQGFDGSPRDLFERLSLLSYPELCKRVLEKFIEPHGLDAVISQAYSTFDTPQVLPLVSKGKLHSLETWHGPTASFKDLSLQLLPRLMSLHGCQRSQGLLVATSGDTGSAALDGFARASLMPVVVLYPARGVSSVQRLQMLRSYGDHVRVIGVNGDFDFCQRVVKSLLNEGGTWTSANSINLGRLLPQVVFSVSAYCSLIRQKTLKPGDPFDMAIPTGNFGNIFAALLARRMGLPLRRLVCASNENNVLTEFLSTGVYDVRSRNLKATISPSIDILVSSNLERWLSLLLQDPVQVQRLMKDLRDQGRFQVPARIVAEMRQVIKAAWVTEEQTLSTIKNVYQEYGTIYCPHTAVAKFASDQFVESGVPMVITSTASFAKFPTAVETALFGSAREGASLTEQWTRLGELEPIPSSLLSLLESKNATTSTPLIMEANEESLKRFIREFCASKSIQ